MHKQKYRCSRKAMIFIGILIFICVCLAWRFVSLHILHTNDEMSLTYSRSATTFPSDDEQWFYVKDNVLYFVEDRNDGYFIRYAKDNIIRTYAKFPQGANKKFIILDDSFVIIDKWNRGEKKHSLYISIYMLNTSDGSLVELWQGNLVGYQGGRVYFTNDSALYAGEIGVQEPLEVISFDELLAIYHDGIVYKKDSCIYQLFLEQPNKPELLTADTIEWPNDISGGSCLDITYLYTSEYVLRAGERTLDMYVYETGEMRRIHEADTEDLVVMAVSANENELYVSRHVTDYALWPAINPKINGTYKYDFDENTWTKITDKTYGVIAQFDERYLYGKRDYWSFSGLGIGQHAVN